MYRKATKAPNKCLQSHATWNALMNQWDATKREDRDTASRCRIQQQLQTTIEQCKHDEVVTQPVLNSMILQTVGETQDTQICLGKSWVQLQNELELDKIKGGKAHTIKRARTSPKCTSASSTRTSASATISKRASPKRTRASPKRTRASPKRTRASPKTRLTHTGRSKSPARRA